MKTCSIVWPLGGVLGLAVSLQLNGAEAPNSALAVESASWLSPTALAAAPDGKQLYVACATGKSVLCFDVESRRVVRSIALPAPPSGLAIAADGAQLYVTCAAPQSRICLVDITAGKIIAEIRAGHTALSPVLSPDGQTLFVCYRFNNGIGVIDLAQRQEIGRVKVLREPVAAALTRDGRRLLVANHLPAGRADADFVAAKVSVVDVTTRTVVKELELPNGSDLLRAVAVSPEGRYACVTHGLARFHLPTTQLDRGWVNTSALTLIDLAAMRVINTVLLDNVDRGAANPWGAAWSSDGKTVVVAHAGSHELSVIDAPALLEKLAKVPLVAPTVNSGDSISATRSVADVPNDLAFLVGVRERIALKGDGPRGLLLVGSRAWIADYFSDTLELVDLASPRLVPVSLALGPAPNPSNRRRGEMWFNDARICFQSWQSCASCHSEDARVDGLNWDLLNDGIGNPKNTKSLLEAHRTPPAMSLGVRETAEDAVRAGIRNSLFTVQPEEVPRAIDEYLKSLKPMASPYLVAGDLSDAARRGRALFMSAKVGCSVCHPPGLFTDLHHYDVGTRGRFDKEEDLFDTPTLLELWRTAPYLHDGSAATVREVLTTANRQNRHGNTRHLGPREIEDLAAYLLSL